MTAHEREKISTSQGTWHLTSDEQGLVYGVLTDNDYPERLVYQMIYVRGYELLVGTHPGVEEVHESLVG